MAKATEKKITVNALERVVKEYTQNHLEWAPESTVQWAGLDIVVKRVLGLKDMIRFVESVANACFDEDGEYLPQLKDFAIRSNILDTYANFTLPSNLETQYKFIYSTDAVSVVLSAIDRHQFDEMLRAIDAKIDYITRMNVGAMEKQVDETMSAINTVVQHLTDVVGGISSEDMDKVVTALSDAKLDEDKLVRAFTRAKYAGDDDDAQTGGEANQDGVNNALSIASAPTV